MKKVQTHKIYGLVIGLILVVISFGTHIANLNESPAVQWLGYIPFLLGIIMNARAFSKANNEFVSFGSVWSSCFKASAIVAIITVIGAVLLVTIFPEIKEEAIEKAITQMEEGNMDEEQMETAIGFTRKSFTAFMVGGTLIFTLFFGAIFSLIGAAIAPKKGEQTPFTPAA